MSSKRRARALAGIKDYVTNLDAGPAFVIDAYHRLFNIEKPFRMSNGTREACRSRRGHPGYGSPPAAPRSAR
jgi:hypothetical protein